MSDLLNDGNIKASFVLTIASIAAPTVPELTAGSAVSLESVITPNGLKITPSTANVDTSNVASTFTTQAVGRRSYAIEVEMKRQTGTDAAYNALPYRTSGYLVVRRKLAASTAFASTQEVEVYPVQTGEPALSQPAANEVQKFTVPMMVTSDPNTRAVIA